MFDIPKIYEIITHFWRCLYRDLSKWDDLDTEFKTLTVEEAVKATDILYQNFDYWLCQQPKGIIVYCSNCGTIFMFDVKLEELVAQETWVCPECGVTHKMSEIISKSSCKRRREKG